MARTKREYEDEIPAGIDLDGEDKDYSVLRADADKARADAAVAVAKYHALKETEERVRRVNDMLRRSLGGTV